MLVYRMEHSTITNHLGQHTGPYNTHCDDEDCSHDDNCPEFVILELGHKHRGMSHPSAKEDNLSVGPFSLFAFTSKLMADMWFVDVKDTLRDAGFIIRTYQCESVIFGKSRKQCTFDSRLAKLISEIPL